jgi:hypothetical protein
MRASPLITNQLQTETFADGLPIRSRYLRVHQVLSWYPFKRAFFYDLLGRGLIKSFVLKDKGALRGIRLVDRDSIDQYLDVKAAEALTRQAVNARSELTHFRSL